MLGKEDILREPSSWRFQKEAKVTVWRAAKQTECGCEFTRSNQQQRPDEVTLEKPAVHLLERQVLPLQ